MDASKVKKEASKKETGKIDGFNKHRFFLEQFRFSTPDADRKSSGKWQEGRHSKT